MSPSRWGAALRGGVKLGRAGLNELAEEATQRVFFNGSGKKNGKKSVRGIHILDFKRVCHP